MLVYRPELISREQAGCGDRGREFFVGERLQRRERLSGTKRSRNRRWLLPAGANANARRVKPQGSNAEYWGCCTKRGADPDPFIRSQILRDASGFFGGID